MTPNVLSIAGSDPSGGAGLQGDLKTISALRGYGMAVVTSLTAQSTTGVSGVLTVPPDFVTRQIDAVFADIRVDAVKIGMLADAATVRAVVDALDRWAPPVVVLDPVMVATSGDRLLTAEAIEVLRSELLPRVDLITPNTAEAAVLLDEPEVSDPAALSTQAGHLLRLGCPLVLLKGGHLTGAQSTDVLVGPGLERTLPGPRVATGNTHGTGCALSSAIATLRAHGAGWEAAAQEAKAWLTGALRTADQLDIGRGHGPVHHLSALWATASAGPHGPYDG